MFGGLVTADVKARTKQDIKTNNLKARTAGVLADTRVWVC